MTVRENTERPITVSHGTNVIAGTDSRRIREAIRQQLGRSHEGHTPDKWDGRAATRILDVVILEHQRRTAAAVCFLPERCA